MRINIPVSLILAGACAASAPGYAQPADVQEDSSTVGQAIVVTGERNESKALQEFVKALTPTGSTARLSRFEHSVCPAVIGLARPQADAVVARMRLVAKTAGIAVGGPRCAPNVVVVATADKAKFLKALWKHRSDYFDSGTQARRLEREPGPAAAWQLQGQKISAGGMELHQDGSGLTVNRTIDPPSRMTEAVRPQFGAAVVVVEKKALAGVTTTQLADYAALRAYTGADPDRIGNSGAPTILHVLEVPLGGKAPITMTNWDLSFLRGYYDVRRTMHTGAQRSAIARAMDKQLHSAPKQR